MRKVGVRAHVPLDAGAALARLADGAWRDVLSAGVLAVTDAGAGDAAATDVETPTGTEAAAGRPVSPAGQAGVGRDGDRLSEWALPFRGGSVRWRQREQVTAAAADASSAAPGIAFEQVEGDFARYSGTWRFAATGAGSRDAAPVSANGFAPAGAAPVSGNGVSPNGVAAARPSCEVLFEARFDLGVPMYDRVVEPLLARVLVRGVRAVLAAAYGEVEIEEDPVTLPEPERYVAAVLASAT
ncbi:hypothetical protein Sme01_55880 [Sphaerisporangium melleum]|uniref:Coenzyme Q-binding protein COQ10 START domain-containing protein n=1 Tax=Sphaerisporangium melleum TaxID=321316 RepID=A0A917VPM1_9ACTN|nr:SRPBCC family protein [Sphaerisporangium melleum]GGL06148.1 hypothetical protein GCM10007964_55550 [Sphaerisporangium melleum]GII73112.1 hypothetical protein Sme01_55880 [Sphaerisporangium melleum]